MTKRYRTNREGTKRARTNSVGTNHTGTPHEDWVEDVVLYVQRQGVNQLAGLLSSALGAWAPQKLCEKDGRKKGALQFPLKRGVLKESLADNCS